MNGEAESRWIDRAGLQMEYENLMVTGVIKLPPSAQLPKLVPAPEDPPEGAIYEVGCGAMFAYIWWHDYMCDAILDAADAGLPLEVQMLARLFESGTQAAAYRSALDDSENFTATVLLQPIFERGDVRRIRQWRESQPRQSQKVHSEES